MDSERLGDLEAELKSLKAEHRIAERLTNDLLRKYVAIDKTIRGDSDLDTDGLIARMHVLENTVNLLRAELKASKGDLGRELKALDNTVNGDMAGNDGHEQRIRELEGKRKTKDKREGYFWHFIWATASGSVLVAGWLIMNWDHVENFSKAVWRHIHPQPVATEKATPKKAKHHKPKPVVVPEVHDEPSSQPQTPQ